jgi:hypothetical protein
MSVESQDREWQLRARMEMLAAVICAGVRGDRSLEREQTSGGTRPGP